MKTVTAAAIRRIAALLFAVLLLLPLVAPFGTVAPAAECQEASVPALQSGSPESGLITESDVYQYLLGEILKCKTEISVSEYNLNEEQIGEVFAMLFYSEAELFFIDGHYSFTRYAGSGIIQTIRPLYPDNVDEIPAMLAEFHEMTDAIIAEVDPTMSDWEKVAFIHDYVALHYDYDHDLEIYDAYAMLKTGIGVCQAYSLLTRYLLKELGIECECVSCKGLNHEWNIVKIGNSWYHMDVTWDDRDDKGFYGQVSHDYFLASDSFFDQGYDDDRNHHDTTGVGWVSPVRATNGKYDGFFADVTTPFIFTDDAIYAISDGSLVTYDPGTETFTVLRDLGLSWRESGFLGGTWTGTYAGLVYINGKLYWNGNKKVYSYDPVTQAEPTVICTYNGRSKLIFGMRASADDRTISFTLALMSDPNSGNVTEEVYTAGGYVITWVVGGTSYETICLKGETPRYEGALELPSNLFDYTFLGWDKTIRQASADATYTAQFRMDRNDVTLEGKTMREQYRMIRAAILLLPYANAGYAEASARAAELDVIASDYASRVSAANATFSGVLFGDE
ncbi:MAG: hypothetical protein IK090_06780 [Clostridia bacterium]|nr:hypothetical protein [Clostridia bacterium]